MTLFSLLSEKFNFSITFEIPSNNFLPNPKYNLNNQYCATKNNIANAIKTKGVIKKSNKKFPILAKGEVTDSKPILSNDGGSIESLPR